MRLIIKPISVIAKLNGYSSSIVNRQIDESIIIRILNILTQCSRTKISKSFCEYSINNRELIISNLNHNISLTTDGYLKLYDYLKEFGITITIKNINGSVDLSGINYINKISDVAKFDNVIGDFKMSNCSRLVSLEGAPIMVHGIFDINSCKCLDNIYDLPKQINGHLNMKYCSNIKFDENTCDMKRIHDKINVLGDVYVAGVHPNTIQKLQSSESFICKKISLN